MVTAAISVLHLQLLGAFQLVLNHQAVQITTGSQRLIAFLALHDRLLPRMYIAGVLWPDVPTARANANLRAGLWRLPASCRPIIDQSAQHLRLANIAIDSATAIAATVAVNSLVLFLTTFLPVVMCDFPCGIFCLAILAA